MSEIITVAAMPGEEEPNYPKNRVQAVKGDPRGSTPGHKIRNKKNKEVIGNAQ
jgi:hypothetical protein